LIDADLEWWIYL